MTSEYPMNELPTKNTVIRRIREHLLNYAPVQADLTLDAFITFSKRYRQPVYPVVDQRSRLCGWLGMAQFAEVVQCFSEGSATRRRVGDIAKVRPPAYRLSDSAEQLTEIVRQATSQWLGGYLPVCDFQGRLLGVLSLQDLQEIVRRPRERSLVEQRVLTLFREETLFVLVSMHATIDGLGAGKSQGYTEIPLREQINKAIDQELDPNKDSFDATAADQWIIVLRSIDWYERCEAIMHRCEGISLGGVELCKDGRGAPEEAQSALAGRDVLVAMGAVSVEPGRYMSHYEVMVAAQHSEARARSVDGSGIFVDDRRLDSAESLRSLVH